MKRFAKVCLSAALAASFTTSLAACGDESEEVVIPEPTDVLTERVSAYDPENPCDSNAVKFTVTRPDAEPEIEYVCQGVDDPLVPEYHALFEGFQMFMDVSATIECACDDAPEDECEAYFFESDVITRLRQRCTNETLILIGTPPPPTSYDFFDCMTEYVDGAAACFELIDYETCDGDAYDDAEDCMRDLGDYDHCFPLVDEEGIWWFETLSAIGQEVYDCDVEFWF